MASVTKRGNVWSVRYRTTDDVGNTTMKRVSGFKTKEEAWEQARLLQRQSDAGIDVHGDALTCGVIMERWFSEHCRPLAETTKSKYSDAIDRLSKMPIYNVSVRRLNASTFNGLVRSLEMGEGGKKPLTVRTVLSITEPLRLSISWAQKQGIVPYNPLASVSLPKAPRRQHRILNEQDVEDLIAVAQGHHFYVPLLLALYGGLRREEVAALCWNNVDLDRKTVTITDAFVRTSSGKRVRKETKTHQSMRTITLPALVIHALRDAPKSSIYVCVSRSGKPFSLDTYPQSVHRLIEKANRIRSAQNMPPIQDANYHDLRHTHAAMCIRLGIQPKVIQERLGHASIKLTMDTYGYLMSGLQEAVADAFDADFQTRKGGHKSGHKEAKKQPKTRNKRDVNENTKADESQIAQ